MHKTTQQTRKIKKQQTSTYPVQVLLIDLKRNLYIQEKEPECSSPETVRRASPRAFPVLPQRPLSQGRWPSAPTLSQTTAVQTRQPEPGKKKKKKTEHVDTISSKISESIENEVKTATAPVYPTAVGVWVEQNSE